MLRVVTLSTLFPDASRPNFGIFVERQTQCLAAHPAVDLHVVAPVGLPPPPWRWRGRHGRLAALPFRETWRGLRVLRPRFDTLPLTRGRWHVAALVRAVAPVLDELRADFPFEVIDASFFFPDGPAAVRLGERYGVPVSIKARGADIHHWGRALATRTQVGAAGEGAMGLLAVSEAMRDDMVALGMPADRIRVHRTGIDPARFSPVDRAVAKTALGVDGPLVVSVGALIERKGHAIVIAAVACLPGVTLLIAGDGPDRAMLERAIAVHGVGDRVRLLGGVAHDELAPLMAAADVMALASRSEGLANAWVEALACGTPIVVSGSGAAAEVLTLPDAGRMVERTPAAFAEAIGAILAAPPDQDRVTLAAAPFSWAANTAELYDHLAGLRRSYAAG